MNCGQCKQCLIHDPDGRYGKCVRKRNRVVKVDDPACDDELNRLDGTRWEDSFGNRYIFRISRNGFVPVDENGTFLTANYQERLTQIK